MRQGGSRHAPGRPVAGEAQAPLWQVLQFPGVTPPLVLPDAPGLIDGLGLVLRGWFPRREATRAPSVQALACLVPEASRPGTFRLHSRNIETPMPYLPVASAICGLVADLGQGFFEERPGAIALHCGAFRIAGRLVVVTGPARAGKSTLIARLTAEPDVAVFCDDILPVMPDGTAIGLGVAPRLRLPLPEAASARFRDHVAECLGPQDARYGFVCAGTIAPHGTRAPLSALVVLDRREDGPARLVAVGKDRAVTELLHRNMADLDSADAAFAVASGLIAEIDCVRLIYADVEDAVDLLRRAFGGGDGVEIGPEEDVPVSRVGEAVPVALDPAAVVAREDGVAVRRLAGSTFLWQPEGTTIWHLNPVAAAVWAVLEIPGSAQDIATVLGEVWPEEPEEVLREDVLQLLDAFVDEGFARVA